MRPSISKLPKGMRAFPPGGACGEAACVQQPEQTRALAFASFGSPLIASVGRGFVLVPITSGADAVFLESRCRMHDVFWVLTRHCHRKVQLASHQFVRCGLEPGRVLVSRSNCCALPNSY